MSISPGLGRQSWIAALLAMFMFAGCGGKSASMTGAGSNSNGAPPSSGTIAAPNVITVTAGQNASGINIVVPAPASTSAPNIMVLGVTTGSGGSASNTGARVSQGATETVLLFGPGLAASQTIAISGPGDVTILNPQAIKSTTGVPGIAFQISVLPAAALGARTVSVNDGHGDITTFTGGLEVTP